MRILLIEDSDSIRRMIEALIAARGHEVVAVDNGAKGLEMALASPPDAVLLDLHLPGQYDGFEVCERLRGHAETRTVPIIVISAMADNEAKERALEKGASAFYTKPFSPTALLKELERGSQPRIKL
jgi:DNA-binding response OmpR family regulator